MPSSHITPHPENVNWRKIIASRINKMNTSTQTPNTITLEKGIQSVLVNRESSIEERQHIWRQERTWTEEQIRTKVGQVIDVYMAGRLPEFVHLPVSNTPVKFTVRYTERYNYITAQTLAINGWASNVGSNPVSHICGLTRLKIVGVIHLPVTISQTYSLATDKSKVVWLKFEVHNDDKLGNVLGHTYIHYKYQKQIETKATC